MQLIIFGNNKKINMKNLCEKKMNFGSFFMFYFLISTNYCFDYKQSLFK